MSKPKIRWREFPASKPEKEGYYFATRNTYGRLSTATLYWNSDNEEWVSFNKCLYPGIPVADVIAFARMPEPYRSSDNKKQSIQIKYLRDIEPIKQFKQGDLIDLVCAEDVYMKKDEFKLIPLGVAMKLPDGYKANVYPRSSTFKKYKIIMANSVGQIDNSYCGDGDEWMFPAIAMDVTYIHKGTRICQFEIVKIQPPIEFEEVDELGNPDRGGIGSTGD